MTEPAGRPVRRWLRHGLVLAGLLVAAGLVQHGATLAEPRSPMPVQGRIGTPVTGRNLVGTVEQAVAAEKLRAGGAVVVTAGGWVVVTATVTAPADNAVPLRGARLVIDDVTYTPTERVSDTLAGATLDTGIPLTGPLVFEVPARAVVDAGRVEVQLAYREDNRLDSVLVVPLGDLVRQQSVDVAPLRWGSQ